MAWVAAVRRPDITFSDINKHMLVCSRHFQTGQPAYEMNETHPDWAPSVHLGHMEVKAADYSRFQRRIKRLETGVAFSDTPDVDEAAATAGSSAEPASAPLSAPVVCFPTPGLKTGAELVQGQSREPIRQQGGVCGDQRPSPDHQNKRARTEDGKLEENAKTVVRSGDPAAGAARRCPTSNRWILCWTTDQLTGPRALNSDPRERSACTDKDFPNGLKRPELKQEPEVSRMEGDGEEPDGLQIKEEEEEEPDLIQIKEEEEEISLDDRRKQLIPKREMDAFHLAVSKSESDCEHSYAINPHHRRRNEEESATNAELAQKDAAESDPARVHAGDKSFYCETPSSSSAESPAAQHQPKSGKRKRDAQRELLDFIECSEERLVDLSRRSAELSTTMMNSDPRERSACTDKEFPNGLERPELKQEAEVSRMEGDGEEPNRLQIKEEEEEEPDFIQMKEEEEEISLDDRRKQLIPKRETDAFRLAVSKSESDCEHSYAVGPHHRRRNEEESATNAELALNDATESDPARDQPKSGNRKRDAQRELQDFMARSEERLVELSRRSTELSDTVLNRMEQHSKAIVGLMGLTGHMVAFLRDLAKKRDPLP